MVHEQVCERYPGSPPTIRVSTLSAAVWTRLIVSTFQYFHPWCVFHTKLHFIRALTCAWGARSLFVYTEHILGVHGIHIKWTCDWIISRIPSKNLRLQIFFSLRRRHLCLRWTYALYLYYVIMQWFYFFHHQRYPAPRHPNYQVVDRQEIKHGLLKWWWKWTKSCLGQLTRNDPVLGHSEVRLQGVHLVCQKRSRILRRSVKAACTYNC